MSRNTFKLAIIVPIYNEDRTIIPFIAELKKSMLKINDLSRCILVDDGSNDDTANLLKNTVNGSEQISLIRHPTNLGYGAALKTGIGQTNADLICVIDADDQYKSVDILSLIPFVQEYDMIVGARIAEAAKYFPWYQKLAKWLVCSILTFLFRQKIPDINSGLRIFRKDIAENYFSILPNGFSFTSSLTLAMLLDGYKINYVPIAYFKRTGKSKIKVFSFTFNFIKSYSRIIYYKFFNDGLTVQKPQRQMG